MTFKLIQTYLYLIGFFKTSFFDSSRKVLLVQVFEKKMLAKVHNNVEDLWLDG